MISSINTITKNRSEMLLFFLVNEFMKKKPGMVFLFFQFFPCLVAGFFFAVSFFKVFLIEFFKCMHNKRRLSDGVSAKMVELAGIEPVTS